MSPEKLGSLIGGSFGLVFILANTGSLPATLAVLLRSLGILALGVVLVSVRRRAVGDPWPVTAGGFGRGYWLVVAAEVLAIAVGLALLNGPLAVLPRQVGCVTRPD